jgi:molecular chaperone GrpE (heat shock protein)
MQARIEEVKQQVAEYEKANQEANDKLAQLQADFKNKSKVKREYITRYIDREIVRYDEKFKPGGICEIPKEFIKAHNDATEKAK